MKSISNSWGNLDVGGCYLVIFLLEITHRNKIKIVSKVNNGLISKLINLIRIIVFKFM